MILGFGARPGHLAVQVEDGVLVDSVAALFPGDLLPCGSADPFLCARIVELGYELTRPGPPRRVEIFGDLPDFLAAMEHALCGALLAAETDAAHLHASGAVVDGRAVLALGRSGAGKSSLALAWSQAGYPLLGDDVVLLDPDGRVRPFRRLVKVDRERLAAQGMRPEDSLGFDPDSDEVWYDPRTAGGWAVDPVPLGVVAMVQYHHGGATRTRDLEGPDGLRHLLDSLMGSGVSSARALDSFIAQLSACRLAQVEFESAQEAAVILADWTRTPAIPGRSCGGGGGS